MTEPPDLDEVHGRLRRAASARLAARPSKASPSVPRLDRRACARRGRAWSRRRPRTARSGSSASATAAAWMSSRSASSRASQPPKPGGERGVVALRRQRVQIGDEREHVLDVEHRAAQRLVALEEQVARAAQARGPDARAGRRRHAVQPVGGGALGQLGQQLLRRLDAAVEHLRRRVELVGQPRPVRRRAARANAYSSRSARCSAGNSPWSLTGSGPVPTAARRCRSRRSPRARG